MGKFCQRTTRYVWYREACVLSLLGCLVLQVALASGATIPGLKKKKPAAAVAANVAGADLEIAGTLADVVKAVEEVAADPVVYGTYVYEHDKTLSGARAVDSSSVFEKSTPGGQVFYKVVDDVVAPRHFKNAEDSGTITVRYVVRAVNPTTVSIRVDAVFVESARREAHASEGAVESAEFGQVQQHLNRIQAREQEAREEMEEEARASGETTPVKTAASPEPKMVAPVEDRSVAPTAVAAPVAEAEPASVSSGTEGMPSGATGSVADLEQRVKGLRRQVEARVKASGAALKSAPFHTATTIQAVPGGAEVAIVILTPYWYGVQTTDGHTGWIQRSLLETLP